MSAGVGDIEDGPAVLVPIEAALPPGRMGDVAGVSAFRRKDENVAADDGGDLLAVGRDGVFGDRGVFDEEGPVFLGLGRSVDGHPMGLARDQIR